MTIIPPPITANIKDQDTENIKTSKDYAAWVQIGKAIVAGQVEFDAKMHEGKVG